MEVKVRKIANAGEEGKIIECWLSDGAAYLRIRPGTACESVIAEPAREESVIKVLKVWPGNDDCEPLLCAEVTPPHSYIVEVPVDKEAVQVIFRVLKAISCGGKDVDVIGLVGECVPGTQSHTPR